MKVSFPIIVITSFAASIPSIWAASSTWILNETVAEFGEWSQGVQASGYNGNYEEFTTVSGNFNNGVHLPSTAANFDEAPVDATALLLAHGNQNGISHLIDTQTSYDLSSTGDSLRFVFANHYINNFAPDNGAYNNNFTLWEVGITTTGQSAFGASGDDSFFLAGVNTTANLTQDINALTPGNTFDVVTYNEMTVNGAGGTLGTGVVLAEDLVLDAVAVNGPTDATDNNSPNPANPGGISYLYDITFTNSGSDTFDIEYRITEFAISGLQESDTITATGNVFTGLQEDVVHGLDEAELDDLKLGLGYRTLDSNNPNSGTTFDINDTYLEAVPEPSSAMLLGFLSSIFLFRRKKS